MYFTTGNLSYEDIPLDGTKARKMAMNPYRKFEDVEDIAEAAGLAHPDPINQSLLRYVDGDQVDEMVTRRLAEDVLSQFPKSLTERLREEEPDPGRQMVPEAPYRPKNVPEHLKTPGMQMTLPGEFSERRESRHMTNVASKDVISTRYIEKGRIKTHQSLWWLSSAGYVRPEIKIRTVNGTEMSFRSVKEAYSHLTGARYIKDPNGNKKVLAYITLEKFRQNENLFRRLEKTKPAKLDIDGDKHVTAYISKIRNMTLPQLEAASKKLGAELGYEPVEVK